MKERVLTLTLDLAKEWHKTASQEVKGVLEKIYPEIKRERYPMSHDELQDLYAGGNISFITDDSLINTTDYFSIYEYEDNRNIIITENRGMEMLAFMQLIALRDCWNEIDNFNVDWSNCMQDKYCIEYMTTGYTIERYSTHRKPLSFSTRETAELFLATFEDLIREAGSLL